MRLNHAVIIGLAGLLGATGGLGQSKQWDKRYGGNLTEYTAVVLPTSDGGFIQGGSSQSGANGDKTQHTQGGYDFWVVKMDANGTKRWDRRYGGANDDYLNSIWQTPDGGYILGGTSESGADGDKTQGGRGGADNWIVKIDATGNRQWDQTYGGAGFDELVAVPQTRDGGYLIACNSSSGAEGDRTQPSRGDVDYWIIKTDSVGRKQWDKRFGGTGRDMCTGALQTRDGGYLLGGYSDSGAGADKTQGSRGGEDYWIVKLDASGTKQWDKRFGGVSDEHLTGLLQTADGGYIVGGDSNSGAGGDKTAVPRGQYDLWIVKVNAQGIKQWDRGFGGNGDEYFSAVAPTADGGLLLAGSTESPAIGDVSEISRGMFDFWLVKLDARGDKRWDKRLGGASQDFAESVAQTADGGGILGGISASPAGGDKTEAARGDFDFWTVKFSGWPADAYEPDDSQEMAKTIASGQVQNHNIHEARDVDWTKFTVTAPGAVNARIETAGAAGDTLLGVYNGFGGPLVADNDDIGGANKFSRVTIPALAPGTYYIQTFAYGNNVALPAYTLAANWTQNYEPDAYESDNGRGTARRIRNGRVQNRSIHAAGNRDWAKFTIAAGGARDVRIETRGASGDTRIRLYNRRLKRLAQDDDSGPGLFSRIRRSSLPAGTYYVRIQEKGDDGTIGAYTLKVRWTQR